MQDVSDYYSAIQLRADRWSSLRERTRSFARNPQGKRAAQLKQEIYDLFASLEVIEPYWAFPGMQAFDHIRRQFDHGSYDDVAFAVHRATRGLTTGAYRRRHIPLDRDGADSEDHDDEGMQSLESRALQKPYFEVLIVDDVNEHQERWIRNNIISMRRPEDAFTYEPVVVPSLQDALIAVLFNHNIQAIIVRPGLRMESKFDLPLLHRYINQAGSEEELDAMQPENYGPELCRLVAKVRPELDAYLVTERSVEAIAGLDLGICRRVFYNQEDFLELHLNILRGVQARYKTPFFTALKEYSKQPTGVFHAMPISRGKSISRSHWIQDMGAFYGPNIFLAETSATSGGLDSLLEPHGPIKEAQELASRAFGSRQTYFATNGTSTCNKIVVQALVRPGDIVLVDRDCHKSHHYGMVLAGAQVRYIDSYPLNEYSMYGAVPLSEIKEKLLKLKAAGKLDKVRMLLLTNCTFDGIVYNVERVMEECLAIKPDLIFLWDEAWFAFARFGPVYRQRTGMNAANVLRTRLKSEAHAKAWEAQQAELEDADNETLINTRLIPPPHARVRVYTTQSTHKTLTSLRQGSMIHVNDQDFKGEVEQSFHEAYMTHTSTSPNYQIIASLDVGRRQVELEGFEFVQRQLEAAMSMRRAISTHPLLAKYFKVLTSGDMIPEVHRESGVESYYSPEQGWTDYFECWENDEFVLDPTRVTLAVGSTGWDGDTFKTKILMDKYGIQINKTSRNTVLFMTNIGTTRSSVAYLIEVLVEIAKSLDELDGDASLMEKRAFENRVKNLMHDLPPLPDFSRFHPAFEADPVTGEGDIRSAFFLSYDEANCDYLELNGSVKQAMESGREVVSASFIIPYPPGFPILVPGQVVSEEILAFMRALDVNEIHGYRPDLGLRVFTTEALNGLVENKTAQTASQQHGGVGMPKKVLRNISEIRRYFHTNSDPIYFISATNFNLLGLDEWAKNFKYICYIDCYGGKHPNVFCPSEQPHAEFQSIEDINNYLLQHKEVIDLIKRRGGKPKFVFLMFDEETERLSKELGADVWFPKAKLRTSMDNKIETVRIGNKAGVPSVPNVLAEVKDYDDLRATCEKAGIGHDLVLQSAFGDSGHTTFFIKSEADFRRHEHEIVGEGEIKIMKRIDCRGSAIEACATKEGTIVGPLMTELVGFNELTPYRGGWCGNEIFSTAFPPKTRAKARELTFKFGEQLRKEGYRGYFELDFLIEKKSGEIWLGELNPRITGASSMTNHAAFAHADAPLFLFHLLEFSKKPFKLDVEELNNRWADPEMIDGWSQMVIKHTQDNVDIVTDAPETGIYKMLEDGRVVFDRFDYHRRAVESENEAFFLRILAPGDYRYEGADLGILVTRGRSMTPGFKLNERAKRWIHGIKESFSAKPLPVAEAGPAVADPAFKIMQAAETGHEKWKFCGGR